MNEAPQSVDLAINRNRKAPTSRGRAAAAGSAPAPRSLRADIADVLPSLQAHAIKLCLNSADAQDLVQDTVERALRFEQTYQPGTNLRAWMHQVMFSLFVTRCRRLRRERRAFEYLSSDPCSWTRPEPPPTMQNLPPRVEGAIEALPQHFAAVIRLVDLQEHSYRDAARHLQVPVGTVMSRLFRGRRLLAGNLERRPVPTAYAA